MNRVSALLGIAVGRMAQARRQRRLEFATHDLSDHDLMDIGFKRNMRGHLVRLPPDYR